MQARRVRAFPAEVRFLEKLAGPCQMTIDGGRVRDTHDDVFFASFFVRLAKDHLSSQNHSENGSVRNLLIRMLHAD